MSDLATSPTDAPAERRRSAVALALLLIATIAAFSPIFANAFTSWDDADTIAKNPVLRLPWLDAVSYYLRHSHMHLYVPTTYAAWATLAAIARQPDGSLAAWPFHAANLLAHLGVVAITLALARRAKLARGPTWLMAAIVALHPMQVEAVAWISGFKDVACALLMFSAALLWTRDARPRTRVLATALFVLAMTTKPTALVTPLIALALVALDGRPLKPAARELIPWFVLAIPFAVIGTQVQPPGHDEGVSLLYRPLVALDTAGWYASTFLWPADLTIDHGRTPTRVLHSDVDRLVPLLGLIAFAIAATVALVRPSTRRRAAVAIALIVLPLAPVSGFLTFDFQAISGVAEHYFYLAMPGAALFVSTLLSGLPKRLLTAATLLVVCLGGWLCFAQARAWRDDHTLYAQVARVNSDSWIAANQQSIEASDRGDGLEAERAARRAIELNPRYPNGYVNLALVYARRGERALAIATLERVYAFAPNNAVVNMTLGSLRAEAGELALALPKLEDAVELDPTNATARANYGNVLFEANRTNEAIAQYSISLRFADDPIVRTHRAMAYAEVGRLAEAREDVAAALARRPDLAEAVELRKQLRP